MVKYKGVVVSRHGYHQFAKVGKHYCTPEYNTRTLIFVDDVCRNIC